jgi:LuxR family maltose regulon positive regulatory protein
MVETLIATKISVPPSRAVLVRRERLFERLDAGLQRKLTVLSAPAGFGKTTLLSHWVEQQERPLAWVALDEQDNDPHRFLTYLAHSLQSAVPDLQLIEKTTVLRQASQSIPIDSTLAMMVNDLQRIQDPLGVVLDDYHVITNQEVHETLSFLIEHVPGNVHLILASRTDPPLPLAKLRASDLLLEISEVDLRFNAAEINRFMQDVMGLDLSQEDTSVLEDRTEGWIAGLQLTALSLEGRANPTEFIASLSGTHRYILDYLTEEVFSNLPELLQVFLQQISPLARFKADLCDAVVGDLFQQDMAFELQSEDEIKELSAKVILEFLDDSNLFIFALDYERQWYRFHPLFSEFLQDQLAGHRPDDVLAIHKIAADWFSKHGFIVEAIDHALSAGEPDRAADLIAGQVKTVLARGEASTLARWIEGLPRQILSQRADLQLALAWSLMLTERVRLIERLQELLPWQIGLLGVDRETIIESLKASTEGSQERAHLSEFALLMAFLERDEGVLDRTIELFEAALEAMPKDDYFVRAFALAGLASTYSRKGDLAMAERTFAKASVDGRRSGSIYAFTAAKDWEATLQAHQGRLTEAESTFRTAIDYLADQGIPGLPLTAHAFVGLAEILLEKNELDQALALIDEGLKRGELVHDGDALREGYLIKARVLAVKGDEAGYREAIEKSFDFARGIPDFPCLEEAKAWEAILHIDLGEISSAARWASSRGLTIPLDPEAIQAAIAIERLAFGRLLLAERKFPEAESVLGGLLNEVEAGGWKRTTIEILTLLTLALHAGGKRQDALRALARALMLAEPEGYVRTFIGKGSQMAAMLQSAAAQGHSPEYVKQLLEAFGEQVSPDAPLEALTERELDVLRGMAAGLTNAEIAEELVIAQSTVKTHINRIYGKLGVTHRTQAVAMARELQLI